MARKPLEISQNPLFTVAVTGKMNEDFKVGEKIILRNSNTKTECSKIIQRVIDNGDGNCTLDL